VKKSPTRHAELSGDDACSAVGMTVQSSSPVLAMCRKLVEAGVDPSTPLDAYRGGALCLCVRSIGEAARLQINSHGTGFEQCRARRAASPIESKHMPVGGCQPPAQGRIHEATRLPPTRLDRGAAE
jgi:hypothetical protein